MPLGEDLEMMRNCAKDITDRIEECQRRHGSGWTHPGYIHVERAIRQSLGLFITVSERDELDRWLPLPLPPIKLLLNDTYTATVDGDKVLVGCQTFKVETLRKLLTLIDERASLS